MRTLAAGALTRSSPLESGFFVRSPSGHASLPKDGLLPEGSSSHVSILHKPVTRPAIRDMSSRHENTSLAAPVSGAEDDRAR